MQALFTETETMIELKLIYFKKSPSALNTFSLVSFSMKTSKIRIGFDVMMGMKSVALT